MTPRKPKLIEMGIVPCRQCRKPHGYYIVSGTLASWADLSDGHSYVRMSAEEVVRFVLGVLRGEAVA